MRASLLGFASAVAHHSLQLRGLIGERESIPHETSFRRCRVNISERANVDFKQISILQFGTTEAQVGNIREEIERLDVLRHLLLEVAGGGIAVVVR